MADNAAIVQAVFQQHITAAQQFLTEAQSAIQQGFASFTDPSAFKYEPYQWEMPSPPQIFYNPTFPQPQRPSAPAIAPAPGLEKFPEIANPDYGKPADFTNKPPDPHYPPQPGSPPSDPTGSPPQPTPTHFPNAPALLPLPSTALPYPYITVPNAPNITIPAFDGQVPSPIHTISFDEYMQKLTDAYQKYSQDIPALVFSNWMLWFKSYLGNRPLIDKLAHAVSTYMDNGGAGIPVPIEEAIVTRNTDRVVAEQRRATLNVYDAAVKRGLLLPSGMLVAGLKEARQVSAEAVSKVATDVAIKNLELEHDYMKFMLTLGSELEKWVASFAVDTCKIVLEANNQAIEMTKFILTGMIEINNTIVKIYLAQWEAYKGAVEVFKAKIEALDAQIKLYEAQIHAELAKVEINKAVVEMLNAVANTNRAIAEVYKVQVDAESAKIEADRVRVMIFEAQVHAYVARVEAWKAQWQGYTAAIEGETAKIKAYEAEVNAYTARVNAYKAAVEGYSAHVHAQAEHIHAIGTQNETNLKAWSTQMELNLKAYATGTEAYRAEWGAVGEQLKGYAEGTRIMADTLYKGYDVEMRVDTEKAHEHLGEWRSALEARIQSAQGMVSAASVSGSMAASALNGLSSFVGALATSGV